MDSFYHSGTEFIRNPTAFQYADALLDPGDIHILKACGMGIILSGRLDIHSHVIDQVLLQQFPQHSRHIAVGVQFHRVSQFFDLL
jgi:hypothetical protein